MKLYLHGHEYRYAVEQMLFTMMPGEKPEYPAGKPTDNCIEVSLSRGGTYLTATCRILENGHAFGGRAAASVSLLTDALLEERYGQRIIRTAMYRAFLASGRKKPAWGSLTGVRPGKIFRGFTAGGMDEEAAVKHFISEYDVSPERAELCRITARETDRVDNMLTDNDICLYIGIPFCPTRCAYCSFVSQSVEKSIKLISPFFDALMREIEATAAEVNSLGLRVVSIYMGGGTPTTLSAAQLDALCKKLEECFDLSKLTEYTVEAGRPDTITEDKLTTLKKHGIGRISVNPQTMQDNVLQTIGRKHTAADIIMALEKVRKVGGFAVNMDLIAGLPADTEETFRNTIDTVIALAPENITVHTLSLKKGSGIMLNGTPLPSAAEVAGMLDYAGEKLSAAGYSPYYLYRQKYMSGGFENVGWTKDGYVNVYNICIMEELCSIIAMGGGGSTKLIRRDGGRNLRLTDPKYPLEYIQQIGDICSKKAEISAFYKEYRQNKQ